MRLAPEILGLVVSKTQKEILIHDAMQLTLDQSGCGEASREKWIYWGERFKDWLKQHHSEVEFWHTLTPDIIQDYLASYRSRSTNTQRHAIAVVRQAARHMSSRYGFPNSAEGIRTSAKPMRTPVPVYLADVAAFCDFLAKNEPRLEAGAALQGLAGLQLQEATRLSWADVDIGRGLIHVGGIVKNAYRTRTIPVCRRVAQALERSLQPQRTSKVQLVGTGAVVLSKAGLPYAGTSYQNYAHEVKAARSRWNPKAAWTPKDLRNAVQQFAVSINASAEMIDQYVGHAPRGIIIWH